MPPARPRSAAVAAGRCWPGRWRSPWSWPPWPAWPRSAARTLTTLPTTGWPEVTDEAGNLSFRHPPGWDVRPTDRGGAALKDGWVLTPADVPRGNDRRSGFTVTVTHGHGYWKADSFGLVGSGQVGRVPGGQAYLHTAANLPQRGTYAVDWGRVCRAGSPTLGDRSRPACRPGQWALVHPSAWGGTPDGRRLAIPVGVGFRGGPACHLRVAVSMAVEQEGRRLPIQGNPAAATIELDLPEDALPADQPRAPRWWRRGRGRSA